jgi:hypothetical protein
MNNVAEGGFESAETLAFQHGPLAAQDSSPPAYPLSVKPWANRSGKVISLQLPIADDIGWVHDSPVDLVGRSA